MNEKGGNFLSFYMSANRTQDLGWLKLYCERIEYKRVDNNIPGVPILCYLKAAVLQIPTIPIPFEGRGMPVPLK